MSATDLARYLECHGLGLVSDKQKYRKVVALQRLTKGSVVITSRPLCNPIIFPTHRPQHCETCFQTRNSQRKVLKKASELGQQQTVELERCSVCKKRYYCDRDCFTIAWKGWHRWICTDKDMEDLDYEMLKMIAISIERLRNGAYKESEDAHIFSAAYEATAPDGIKTKTTTAIKAETRLDSDSGSETGTETEIRGLGSSPPSTWEAADKKEEPLGLTAYVFSTLLGHESISDPSLISKYRQIATRVRQQLLGSKFVFKSEISGGEPPSVTELMQYLCRFHCNNFSVHDAQLFTMAEGTFPVGALFNHSCRPNATVMYEGKLQVVRALEDIETGQEICTSYVDNGVQRLERRQLLREKYFFECRCPRCGNDQSCEKSDGLSDQDQGDSDDVSKVKQSGFRILDDLIEGNDDGPERGKNKVSGEWLTEQFKPIVLPGARFLQVPAPTLQPPSIFTRATFTSYVLHSLVPLIQTGVSEREYTSKLFEVYQTLQTTQHSHPKPFTTTVMTNATSFFNTCLEHQSWTLASKIGAFILALYLMIYPRHHPLVGLHCFTLAKSLWNDIEGGLTSVRLSHEILRLSLNILKVSHGNKGDNGSLVQEVIDFMKTVDLELGS
ncbi:hypothetical protein BX616_002018 [Lobosporangium transversale]|uniref:SET domain-containing protein n=1 Tax=Lobosporangium transversale TaxID=64571 RepID=A0A1Y2GXV4_9FUNG|nr:hypothetical protein BCR41DRAFT_349812 [Lobosporangium transversale]KAF9902181.1 hypothetical protein BX616_002018 [Lobosporangium transversale]ORZ22863.1 hypothetical protein BCR41DRAFT_349812 [Lobosporangium transversale]|eukprot:XP_021883417.1 hypothetical protein BCR41DRAFT_349812 [Lobosporangium transversale]